MKKSNLLIVILLLFSIIIDASLAMVTTHAESKGIELVDEKFLKLSYICEEDKDALRWQVNYQHQSEHGDEQQRFKFKITDEKDHVVDYPKLENLVEKDGWLVEREFSDKKDEQFSLKLSQSEQKLKLYVQMDQEKKSNKTDEKASEIKKDILEREGPYILEFEKKAKKTASTESSVAKKETQATSVNSEEFIGPKTEVQKKAAQTAAPLNMNSMYANSYQNKAPEYKEDAGKYPEFSWKPTGQTNVINHQGGLAGQTGWDNEADWNVGWDDFSKSYIKYGDADNANIQLRKYAQQTEKPDEFKIKLNVKGNTTYKPGVDIVFLLDNSQSMDSTTGLATGEQTRKKNAEVALKRIVDELKLINEPSAENIRIGAEIFSDYTYPQSWGSGARSGEKRKFLLSKNSDDWDKIVTEYSKKDMTTGVTFTQRGLQEAKDIFDASPSSDRHKLLFVLTDGAPNRSWTTSHKGTSNLDIFPDLKYFTNFNKGTKPNYSVGSSLHNNPETMTTSISPAYGGVINSHITTTNSTAMDLKNAGIEIHTIALKLMINYTEQNMPNVRQNQIRGLYKMSTKKANATNGPMEDNASDYHFYDVTNGDDLVSYFKNWYETIIRTVDKGVITDPLGDMVELVPGSQNVRQIRNGTPLFEVGAEPRVSPENNDRQIRVDNINLSRNQEIEVEYTVRLKTNDDSFVSGRWYPANGRTTLEPTPERTNDLLDFGVPSVRYQKKDFVIPVKKIWTDKEQNTDNYWGLRPDKITVTLQKLNGSNWVTVESKDLNDGNNWQTAFSAVEGGANNTYRVVETTRVSGYKPPVMNQTSFTSENIISGGITITNDLLKGNYQFSKFMEDGTTVFGQDKPKFSVTRKSDNKVVATNLEPNASGKVTIPNMPKGDFIVEETYVPAGYKKMANFEINVAENNPPTSLVFKVNNRTEEYHAINELKDFSLRVEKVDSADNPLTGAAFKLTGPNYNQTINTGSVFNFTNLRPGVYTLTEVENPEGYKRIQDPIGFVIGVDGKVTINSHPNVSGSGGTNGSNNTINLKVTNEKVKPGVLPRTGDFGIRGFFLIASVLAFIGVAIGGFCFYKVRKELARNTRKMSGQ